MEEAEQGLTAAARGDGELRARIAASAARVRELKQRHLGERGARPPLSVLGSAAHRALAELLAKGE